MKLPLTANRILYRSQAGLPRTGTTSLKRALHILNLKPCHHCIDVAAEAFPYTEARLWQRALALYGPENKSARQAVLRQIFSSGKYAAAVDYPAAIFVHDLAEMYPEAKFIHCVRSSREVWQRSVSVSTAPIQKSIVMSLVGMWIPNQLFKLRGLRQGLASWDRRRFGVSVNDEGNEIVYDGYARLVEEVVPPERLLKDFEPAMGWTPLCELLGLPLPRDEDGEVLPYPHLNDASAMKGRLRNWVRKGLTYWGIALVMGLSGSYGAVRLGKIVMARVGGPR